MNYQAAELNCSITAMPCKLMRWQLSCLFTCRPALYDLDCGVFLFLAPPTFPPLPPLPPFPPLPPACTSSRDQKALMSYAPKNMPKQQNYLCLFKLPFDLFPLFLFLNFFTYFSLSYCQDCRLPVFFTSQVCALDSKQTLGF